MSPIVATPTAAQSVDEDGGLVELKGVDESDAPGVLCFEILAVPSRGALKDPESDATLAVGDVLTASSQPPYDRGVDVYYEGAPPFFNTPSTTWNGSALAAEAGDPVRRSCLLHEDRV